MPPQVAPFDFGDEAINSGDAVSVSCTVTKGDLPFGIKWTFNDKTMDVTSGVTISRTTKKSSQLIIESVQDVHSGNYTCAVKNQAGIAKQSAILHVNGTIASINP